MQQQGSSVFPRHVFPVPLSIEQVCDPLQAPRSPLFSRAVCVKWNVAEQQLFLSGTAGILGHETRRGGDVIAHTDAVGEGHTVLRYPRHLHKHHTIVFKVDS